MVCAFPWKPQIIIITIKETIFFFNLHTQRIINGGECPMGEKFMCAQNHKYVFEMFVYIE